jgi:hypothetical protein
LIGAVMPVKQSETEYLNFDSKGKVKIHPRKGHKGTEWE